jgi:putative transposase
MKASQFLEAQKAFILKQGDEGVSVAEICWKARISQGTYFNWKKKYAGMLPAVPEDFPTIFRCSCSAGSHLLKPL